LQQPSFGTLGGMDQPTPLAPRPPDSRRGALIGLAILFVLVVGGLILARAIHSSSQLQDCELAGRKDCAPGDPAARP